MRLSLLNGFYFYIRIDKPQPMPKTITQLEATAYDYLVGADLTMWIGAQVLITQDTISPNKIATAVNTAIGELKAAARTKYNLVPELAKTGADRDVFVVKILGILAVRNAIGSASAYAEPLAMHFEWVDKEIKAIRMGQSNLLQLDTPLPTVDPVTGRVDTGPGSRAEMIASSFLMIG